MKIKMETKTNFSMKGEDIKEVVAIALNAISDDGDLSGRTAAKKAIAEKLGIKVREAAAVLNALHKESDILVRSAVLTEDVFETTV